MGKSTILSMISGTLLLTGCAMANHTLEDYVNNNDLQGAVEHALKQQHKSLLVAAVRNPIAPGLTREQYELAKQHCKTVMIPNVSDVKTPENRNERAKSIQFAKKYNQQIMQYCQ